MVKCLQDIAFQGQWTLDFGIVHHRSLEDDLPWLGDFRMMIFRTMNLGLVHQRSFDEDT